MATASDVRDRPDPRETTMAALPASRAAISIDSRLHSLSRRSAMTPGPEPCQGPEVTTPRIERAAASTQQRVPGHRLFSVTCRSATPQTTQGRSRTMLQTHPTTRSVAAPTRSVAPAVVSTAEAVAK